MNSIKTLKEQYETLKNQINRLDNELQTMRNNFDLHIVTQVGAQKFTDEVNFEYEESELIHDILCLSEKSYTIRLKLELDFKVYV